MILIVLVAVLRGLEILIVMTEHGDLISNVMNMEMIAVIVVTTLIHMVCVMEQVAQMVVLMMVVLMVAITVMMVMLMIVLVMVIVALKVG